MASHKVRGRARRRRHTSQGSSAKSLQLEAKCDALREKGSRQAKQTEINNLASDGKGEKERGREKRQGRGFQDNRAYKQQ